MNIIFATKNQGKLKEIRAMLDGTDLNVVSAEEVGITDDIPEEGQAFSESAVQKARFVFERVHDWTAAEDTGLCIEALDGEPGIFTARRPGEGGGHAAYTLERMKHVPSEQRAAYFITIVAVISPEGREYFFEGRVDGVIPEAPQGEAHPHLPYDTVFIPTEGDGRTFAEMSDEEKNTLSHRGRAILKMKEFLQKFKE